MTPSQKLAKIAKIYETVTKDKSGVSVSTHAGYNLDGVLLDIQRTGTCDSVCINTLKRIRIQLAEIAKVLKL